MAFKNEQDLSLYDLASSKTSDAQKLMGEARKLLQQDLENVRQEKLAFEEMTKTLNEIHFASTVKLNVGGKIYKTALATLQKDPDSMLCAMFSGKFELKPDDEDGAYFIDRDAELFRYILNYLRNDVLHCPDERTVLEDLLVEARFYQVQGLIAQLERKMHPLKSSVIIKDGKHRKAVMSWLPPGASCSLLFRATTDGGTPKDFHHCCDNKGATLVVIQSGKYICGGYTSKSWESPDSLISVPDFLSFLFSLVKPSNSEPIKIPVKPDGNGGIGLRNDFGPTFASTSCTDLYVLSSGSGNMICKANLGGCFSNPEGYGRNATFFTGENQFKVTEMEVFKIAI
ncbi:uncharacterized protein [Montipora capricornis]|uniref:uncharacterized protein n=1 Tax=Montipora capricornis TaxID=246305 RepID=UPI0035F1CE97